MFLWLRYRPLHGAVCLALGILLLLLMTVTMVPAEAAERRGGTLVVATTQVPRHLNPAVQSGIATAMPGTQIFASPLRFDGEWNPQPYLAESWQFSADGLSLTLNLVKNARFHDGTPITSEDVAFSIATIKKNHPFVTMFAPVERVDTPDPHTAILRLTKPHPALLIALSPALCPIIPKHIYGDGQDPKTHPANSAPIGSGPYKLVSFVPGEATVLERNDDFFIPDRPALDKIIFRVISDPSALLISVENGDADIYPFMSGSQEIRRLSTHQRLDVTDRGYDGIGPINWLAFNTENRYFRDPRTRQALAYAIDRDFITNVLHRGVSKPQRGPIIESSPFFDAAINPYDVDLDKARSLLDQAGWTRDANGQRFSVTVDYIPGGSPEQQRNVAEYLKSQLKKIGINVVLRASPDFPSWARRISNHQFEMTMDIVFNWGDPVIGVHRTYLSSNIIPGTIWTNTQQYRNLEVDALLAKAGVEPDAERRRRFYSDFQNIVAADLPVYWINALPYYTAYDSRLGNPPLSIWGMMSPLDTLYWKSPK